MASVTSRSSASPAAALSPPVSATVSSASSAVPESIDDPPPLQFTTVQDLFNKIDCAPGDFVTVTHVSARDFNEIDQERESRRRRFRVHYDSSRRILLIRIPTEIHEQLHLGLYQAFHAKLVRNGQEERWTSMGSATFRGQRSSSGRDCGEGDSTGGPWPERGTKGAWPTLVMEAGFSQSLSALRNAVRWWFAASEHQVQIVLLAKFEQTRRAIILEKWEEKATIPRPGAMTTRHAAALEPMLRQTITITQDPTTDPVSYNVTRGALVLGFRPLFLRDPGPQEGEFVFSVQELQVYAERAWSWL